MSKGKNAERKTTNNESRYRRLYGFMPQHHFAIARTIFPHIRFNTGDGIFFYKMPRRR